MTLQFGLDFPNELDARTLVDLGVEAENAGWDGVFLWDTLLGTDAWVVLSAVAARTSRVRLGPMVAPLPRRQPWKLANETIALDQLSNGRLILPVGLGVADHERWNRLGMDKEMDQRVRAKLLDEGLDVLTRLWSGQTVNYRGEHLRIEDVQLAQRPVQSPRIPIWVPGQWPNPPKTQLRRMPRWDGVLVGTNVDVRELRTYLAGQRDSAAPFDVVVEAGTPGDDPARATAIVQPLAEAGVTWWIESIWDAPRERGGTEGMRTRIRQGPPRLE
jgi:hypothetical protein